MGENSVSIGSSQATAASAAPAQTIQQSQPLESILAKIADSAAKPIEIKPYIAPAKLDNEGKQPEFYKKEAGKGAEIKQESKKENCMQGEALSPSKDYIFNGTAAPVMNDDKKPVDLGNSTELQRAVFKDSFLSKAFNLGILKSFAYRMKEALFGALTVKVYAPAYSVSY